MEPAGTPRYYSGAKGQRFTEGTSSAVKFPEQTWFRSGDQFLGYLEGRPGASRLISVEPWHPVSGTERGGGGGKGPSAEVRERVAQLPQVQEAHPSERAPLIEEYLDAWEECEEGAFVEVEIDYEEAT